MYFKRGEMTEGNVLKRLLHGQKKLRYCDLTNVLVKYKMQSRIANLFIALAAYID